MTIIYYGSIHGKLNRKVREIVAGVFKTFSEEKRKEKNDLTLGMTNL